MNFKSNKFFFFFFGLATLLFLFLLGGILRVYAHSLPVRGVTSPIVAAGVLPISSIADLNAGVLSVSTTADRTLLKTGVLALERNDVIGLQLGGVDLAKGLNLLKIDELRLAPLAKDLEALKLANSSSRLRGLLI